MTNKLADIINELSRVFDCFNETKFDNTLIKPIITIQSGYKQKAYGWCSMGYKWNDVNTEEGYYEINILAEYIARPVEEVMETLLHEMIHLYNQQNDIRDFSKQTGRHLKQFKEACDRFGLTVEKDDKGDWCLTSLNDELIELIGTFNIKKELFNVQRQEPEQKLQAVAKPRKRLITMICACGNEIKCKYPVKCICQQCGQPFEEL